MNLYPLYLQTTSSSETHLGCVAFTSWLRFYYRNYLYLYLQTFSHALAWALQDISNLLFAFRTLTFIIRSLFLLKALLKKTMFVPQVFWVIWRICRPCFFCLMHIRFVKIRVPNLGFRSQCKVKKNVMAHTYYYSVQFSKACRQRLALDSVAYQDKPTLIGDWPYNLMIISCYSKVFLWTQYQGDMMTNMTILYCFQFHHHVSSTQK